MKGEKREGMTDVSTATGLPRVQLLKFDYKLLREDISLETDLWNP